MREHPTTSSGTDEAQRAWDEFHAEMLSKCCRICKAGSEPVRLDAVPEGWAKSYDADIGGGGYSFRCPNCVGVVPQ
jgi:hypothetical protein